MITLLKLSTCVNLLDTSILIFPIMFLVCVNLFMVLSRPLERGTNALLSISLFLGFSVANLIALFSLFIADRILSTYFYISMILS